MNYLIATTSNTSRTTGNVSDLESIYTEYKLTKYIWIVIPPILLLLGTVGNCVTITVYAKTQMRTSAMAVYLSTLALSDIVALYTGLLTEWIQVVFDSKTLSKYGTIGCKLHSWLLFTSVQFSAWIIAVITLERVVCVWLPFRARLMESTAGAKIVVIFLCFVLLSVNSHALYGITVGSEQAMLYPSCAAKSAEYLHFFKTAWPYIDSILYCFIPCTLILCGNSVIILKTRRKTAMDFRFAQGRSCSDNQTLRDRRTQFLLPLVFTLNTVFLLTTAPISVFQIVLNFTHISITAKHSLKHAQLFLGWTILIMVMFTNHAINCLLYCLSGAQFRRKVFSLLCKKRRTPCIMV